MEGSPIVKRDEAQPVSKVHSIHRRFSRAFIGIVTLILLAFAVVAILINVTRLETKLQKSLETIVELSKISLPTPLWNLDNDIVRDYIEALFLDDALVYAEVVWEGRVIAVKNRPKFQGRTYDYFTQSSTFMTKTGDILFEGSKVGTLHIAVSRASIRQELLLNIVGIIALTLFLIVAISLTSIVITRRSIARPLSRLQQSATAIARGDLEAAIDTSSQDEIGSLARDLNTMRQSIQQLFGALRDSNAQLEESNRTLEARVAARTRELQDKNVELEKTLIKLQEMQQQIIMQEKMASLGSLTAGIAHEIKNPLNFVNNFAELSTELTRDLRDDLEKYRDGFAPEVFENLDELLQDLELNTQKIREHGKRADSIVHNMLLHSRGTADQREPTDLNALVAESINLAYHGLRAKDASFNVTIETDYDPSVGKLSIVPQNMSRVFLNVINNACYAAHIKRQELGEDFIPTLSVRTRNLGDHLAVYVRDNGDGIPVEAQDKVFQPFFTTKPTGVGTGLGLSLIYDIVTQEHHGELCFNTEVGHYTEFVITLPRQDTSVQT